MNQFPFIGPAYETRSENYSAQQCINWYLEFGEGKTPAMLVGCPGLTAPWVTLSGGGVRGCHVFNDADSIWVCGTNVYRVSSSAATTVIGTITNDSRPVTIASNGVDIVIVSAGVLYSLLLTGTTATTIRTGIGQVDYLDGYFLATETGTGNFIWSNPNTATFPALNIQDTNGSTDSLTGVKCARRAAHFLGKRSIETWYNQGASADLPFASISGAFFEIGCVAIGSIAELDAIFWLAGDDKGANGVWTMVGGAPQKISTPAVEFAINRWSDPTDAEGFCYSDEGHSFYVLSSNSGNQTWVYDISTQKWHQRAYLDSFGNLTRIRPRCFLRFAGKNLVGDWENGNIYEYDLDTYTDNGNPIPAIRSCVAVQDGLEMQRGGTFQLDMDTGVGLSVSSGTSAGMLQGLLGLLNSGISGDTVGADPKVMLRWSKDGGKTWSNELWRSFGKIGEYAKRVRWNRVGGGRRSVFEVTITDPVRRNITGAFLG